MNKSVVFLAGTSQASCTTSIFFNRAIQYLQTNAIIKHHYHHCQWLVNNIQRSFTQCCGELAKDKLHPNIRRGDPTLTGHLSITNTGVIIYRIESNHSAHYWYIIIIIGKSPRGEVGGRTDRKRRRAADSNLLRMGRGVLSAEPLLHPSSFLYSLFNPLDLMRLQLCLFFSTANALNSFNLALLVCLSWSRWSQTRDSAWSSSSRPAGLAARLCGRAST